MKYLIALVFVLALVSPGRALADEASCSSLSFYLNLASGDLDSAATYQGYDKAYIPAADKTEFNHELALAESYKASCTYVNSLARYDVQRGLLILRAAKLGLFDEAAAAQQTQVLLEDAVCKNAGQYDPQGMSSFKSGVAAIDNEQKIPFVMPSGCR
jgi:hypothetical protein